MHRKILIPSLLVLLSLLLSACAGAQPAAGEPVLIAAHWP